jgi:uncharacterized protein (DUF2147 family)
MQPPRHRLTAILKIWACAAALSTAAMALAAEPEGRYLTASGNLEVEVAPCGTALCGTVARVLANRSMSQPGTAMPSGSVAAVPGMTILSSFVSEGDTQPSTTWHGSIFNRENGKTYSTRMSLDGSGNLVLRVYVGVPLFGSTQVWTRLPAAGAAPAAASAAASGTTK